MKKDTKRPLQDGNLKDWLKKERRQPNANNTLVQLPADVLFILCFMLPLETLCSLSCVCQQLSAFIMKTNGLWKERTLKLVQKNNIDLDTNDWYALYPYYDSCVYRINHALVYFLQKHRFSPNTHTEWTSLINKYCRIGALLIITTSGDSHR